MLSKEFAALLFRLIATHVDGMGWMGSVPFCSSECVRNLSCGYKCPCLVIQQGWTGDLTSRNAPWRASSESCTGFIFEPLGGSCHLESPLVNQTANSIEKPTCCGMEHLPAWRIFRKWWQHCFYRRLLRVSCTIKFQSTFAVQPTRLTEGSSVQWENTSLQRSQGQYRES